ncbi:FecR family protein [Snuella sedimenti]|uniref:FecR family protein n=1 Tax=Snuella sedimenti TaxID=2798802 RepID=A0A8J7IHF1_9FLAO|nr:FecR domain-containing protein [Snuella sedimenti]MBJ6368388.1 FecR family protein [Snuella sedimenti]
MSKKQTPYHISRLIYKSVTQTISKNEKDELLKWMEIESNRRFYHHIAQKSVIEKKKSLYKATNKEIVYKRIVKQIEDKKHKKAVRLKRLNILKYAAVFIIFLTAGTWVYNRSFNETIITENAIKNIKPGYEKATLVLSDGTTIDLEEHKNELIASSNTAEIQNTDKGLVYNIVGKKVPINNIPQALKYNTLRVPVGGMYQVTLPDGTKAWLNSATSLKYPERFDGEQRIVELEGEAYFEVTKSLKEFIVKTNTADITVLGTQFNVSAYANDSYFSSTLVEGMVRLSSESSSNSVILSPNQRAILNHNDTTFNISQVDTEIYTAWKEGKFYFERERLDNILTRVSRWYNIDVVFENDYLKDQTFTGVVLKNKTIDNLLDMISKTTRINYTITKNKTNDKYELKLTRD